MMDNATMSRPSRGDAKCYFKKTSTTNQNRRHHEEPRRNSPPAKTNKTSFVLVAPNRTNRKEKKHNQITFEAVAAGCGSRNR